MGNRKHLHGFDEFDKLLSRLPDKIEQKVLQGATGAAARIIAKEVKNSAPEGKGKQSPSSKTYGFLKSNIVVQLLKNRKSKGQRGSRVVTGDSFWGMFIEFGTRYIAARPWFRPAVEAATGEAVDKLKLALGRGIEREAKKLYRGK